MVIVLDKHKKPLGFATERRIRILMEKHRACLYRVFPAIVIIKDVDSREFEDLPTYRIKLDPGSKYTGIAIVRNETNEVMFTMQIEHRGDLVRHNKKTQKNSRRNRRNRETPYRRCKYSKKGGRSYDSSRKKGWLPPSVKSTADNVISWVRRLCRWINITECSFEAVRFDTQLLDNPDIEGMEYQHGELFGLELKEYLLDKYGHECQYCHGESEDSILEWEHIRPKSKGGSDKVSNATLSCSCCNQEKGNTLLPDWLENIKASKPYKTGIKKEAKDRTPKEKLAIARVNGIENVMSGKNNTSNRYCAWVSSTRKYIESFLFDQFKDVECSSGGRTKYNREKILKLPKDHHYDALSVGSIPEDGYKDLTGNYTLYVKAQGRGSRLRGNVNKCGIIITKYTTRAKTYKGFQSGDIVVANVPEKYKYHGHMVGRITIRHSGNFNIKFFGDKTCNVNYKFCRILQKDNGYSYQYKKAE